MIRSERFEYGTFAVDLTLPKAADELIDVSEFNRDERLPYWADVWPAARALTRYLLDRPRPSGRVIELGCGIALPSLALRANGVQVLATDYYTEALEFALANAESNGIAPPDTLLLDWREPPADLGQFDLVLAADVLYERRNAESLSTLLPLITPLGGTALIADPGRMYEREFRTMLETLGWKTRDVAAYDEETVLDSGVRSRVTIIELVPGAING